MEDNPLWIPRDENTQLDTFRKLINEKYNLQLGIIDQCLLIM